ncbi:TetR/AcrR family transcriptional regulator [Parasphingorhabdus pacifica]
MPRESTDDRSTRILDAAGELLLQFGYRKVTIEDIANRVGIGKGTVYLHWRTKEELFETLLVRETADVTEEIRDLFRADPRQVRPHNYLRNAFLIAERRPLMRALMASDTQVIGLAHERSLRERQLVISARVFEVLRRHGLLRDDVPALEYAMKAAATGFYMIDGLQAEKADEFDLETKANAFSHVIRHSFEPAAEPSDEALVAAAQEVGEMFGDLISAQQSRAHH